MGLRTKVSTAHIRSSLAFSASSSARRLSMKAGVPPYSARQLQYRAWQLHAREVSAPPVSSIAFS